MWKEGILVGPTVDSPVRSQGRYGFVASVLGLIGRLARQRFRRIVTEAIALTPRGFVRAEQTVRDTSQAILRCFATLPDVAAIDVRVLEPRPPNRLVCAGRVLREDTAAARSLASPRMRLQLMGIRCLTE